MQLFPEEEGTPIKVPVDNTNTIALPFAGGELSRTNEKQELKEVKTPVLELGATVNQALQSIANLAELVSKSVKEKTTPAPALSPTATQQSDKGAATPEKPPQEQLLHALMSFTPSRLLA